MAQLEDVLKDFEKRLSSIENQIRNSAASIADMQTIPVKASIAVKLTVPNAIVNSTPTSEPAKPNKATGQALDSSSVLGLIGIIFVVLAGVFFIKISIDSGWLTPIRQILIAAGTGLTFFFIPQLFSKAAKEYGSLLAGAGVTILHLTWIGAYSYHQILGAVPALVCASLIGVFAVMANFDKGNKLFLLVAMAGTYLAAPIVGYNMQQLSVLTVFLVIWNISFSAAAFMNKRRDILFIASYYAVFTVLLLSEKALGAEQQLTLLYLQIIQFLIFSAALLSYSIFHKNPMSDEESTAIFPVLVLFYFSAQHLVKGINPEMAPWLGAITGAVVLGIYFLARTFITSELKSAGMLATFATMAFVHSLYFQLLDEVWQPLAAIFIGLCLMVVWNKSEKARTLFYWPAMIFLATFFYGAILTVVSTNASQFMFIYNWSYGTIALVTAISFAKTENANSRITRYAPLLLGFGHLEVMLGLYRFSQQISWSGTLFLTLTWSLYAALILGIAFWRRDKILGNSALTILLAVSLKAFFYDVSNTSSIIRVVCLLAEGLLLYCCGWIFKKMQSWSADRVVAN